MTTTPTSGAAIQRYKIGYHADEWGQRSSTPSGIPDASGSWVRYADHVTALAAGQATAAPTHEQIAAYLESTGAYVTNDATREAAIAEAIDTDRAKRGQALRLLTQKEKDSLGRRAEGMDGNEWDQWVQEKFAQVNGLKVQGGSYEWDWE